MNISLIVNSLKYIRINIETVSKLSIWIYNSLVKCNYHDQKLINAFIRDDFEILELFCKEQDIYDKFLSDIIELESTTDESILKVSQLFDRYDKLITLEPNLNLLMPCISHKFNQMQTYLLTKYMYYESSVFGPRTEEKQINIDKLINILINSFKSEL